MVACGTAGCATRLKQDQKKKVDGMRVCGACYLRANQAKKKKNASGEDIVMRDIEREEEDEHLARSLEGSGARFEGNGKSFLDVLNDCDSPHRAPSSQGGSQSSPDTMEQVCLSYYSF